MTVDGQMDRDRQLDRDGQTDRQRETTTTTINCRKHEKQIRDEDKGVPDR